MTLTVRTPNKICADVLSDAYEIIGCDVTCELHSKDNVELFDSDSNASHAFPIPFKLGDVLIKTSEMLHVKRKLPQHIAFGNKDFYPDRALFKRDDKDIALTEKEVSLLIELWRALPQSVSKNALLESVWGYQSMLETHTLETHIYRLRQKIETDPSQPQILITEKDGYKLNVT